MSNSEPLLINLPTITEWIGWFALGVAAVVALALARRIAQWLIFQWHKLRRKAEACMESNETAIRRIPVICVHPSSVQQPHIFNPNEWERESKGIIGSCSAEYSALHFVNGRIAEICRSSKQRCQRNFDALRSHWNNTPWDSDRCVYYVEDPELHCTIEAFFSGVKSLLDLIVQLIATEKIVESKLDGFHRVGSTYGGKVLNCLEHNVSANMRQLAGEISALIKEHKELWIDHAIRARDQLVHPELGTAQLMFHMDLSVHDGNLTFNNVTPPVIGGTNVAEYSGVTIEHVKQFSVSFLKKLHIKSPAP